MSKYYFDHVTSRDMAIYIIWPWYVMSRDQNSYNFLLRLGL